MIEARVECICVVGYNLSDLGVIMRKGDVLWFPEAQARASKDLRVAERAKAVTVRWKERCSVAHPPIPVFVKPPKNKVRTPTPTSPSRPPNVGSVVAPAPVSKDAAPSLRGVMLDEDQKPPRDQLRDVVHTQVSGEHNVQTRSTDEPAPVPTIKAGEPARNGEFVTSDSIGLDGATEVLKVVRRKKRG